MRRFLTLVVLIVSLWTLAARARGESKAVTYRFDFGNGAAAKGFTQVPSATRYDPRTGFGWLDAKNLVDRDRKVPDDLRGDYAFGRAPATFRVDVKPGIYRMTLIFGDTDHDDHVLQASVDVPGVTLPQLVTRRAEFATLTAAFEITSDQFNLRCDSPDDNWVLNALVLELATKTEPPSVTKEQFQVTRGRGGIDNWGDVKSWPDPIAPFLKTFRDHVARAKHGVNDTHLKRAAYLKLIAGNVDFWKQHQDARGAIIDPYRKVEFQYSTPCFAYAAATLVAHAGREDLLEAAAKAYDFASSQLAKGEGATNHDDFYPPPLAHAYPLLKDRVAPQRSMKWASDIAGFDPYTVYTSTHRGGNWNVVAFSGEFIFHKLGLRKELNYVENSLKQQGKSFSPWGMYTESPMAYDHFPRLWAADMIAAGYAGARAAELSEVLRRGALTSLFLQSPTGELPTGGRSAQHQWNEAQQCVTYEIYAAKALADGDAQLAGVFKRAARLALSSMQRWVRPSGEMWIVKNRADPKEFHGYESYSAHSQYNLLPMAMLAIAYEHAEKTENVPEQITPAEVGGFVLEIAPVFHKVIANAGGMYIEIDVAGDPAHNPTGLLRIHKAGFNPLLGPSDGLIAKGEVYPADAPRTTAAVGAAWRDASGAWKRLAEFPGSAITRASVVDLKTSPTRVEFGIVYEGDFDGPQRVVERYVVTPEQVEQAVELPGYSGPARMVIPLLDDLGDGEKTQIATDDQAGDKTLSVSLAGEAQTFAAPGAGSISVEEARYPFRNGWARLGVAEFPAGTRAKLIIRPQTPRKLAP